MEKRILINNEKTNYTISEKGIITNTKTGYILQPIFNKYGRAFHNIKYCGKTYRHTRAHWMALYFIPNPNQYPEVDHIDGDCTNDVLSNFE